MKQAIWIAILSVFAALTVAVQLDREAGFQKEIATVVPSLFRAGAQEQLARMAVAEGDGPQALVEARELLKRRPLPAGHVRLLAQAQFLSGDPASAAQTFQIAATRGWRDPASQEAMLRIAIAAGAKSEAVRRYAALMARSSSSDTLLAEFGEAALSEEESRKEFAAIVAASNRWKASFLRRGARSLPAPIYADVVAKTIAMGADFDCSQIEFSVKSIEREDEASAKIISDASPPYC